MFNAFTHAIKPSNRTWINFTYPSLIHYQYRNHQIGTKSQSRSQSTYNPSIPVPPTETDYEHTPNIADTPKSEIITSFKTPLNDQLIPSYLHDTYWWAYTNPNAVKFWERQWLVDAILWGNFNRLKKEAINELYQLPHSLSSSLNITQIACVYGNFSTDLLSELMAMHRFNGNVEREYKYKIVDIAPIQLMNTRNKVNRYLNENVVDGQNDIKIEIDLYQNDSMNMESINGESEDLSYLFFLLHEQPKDVRLRTIEETLRITKEGGKIVIVDYHKPKSTMNPFRYIMYPILTYLEPFAIDLWNEQVTDYILEINKRNKWNISMEKTLFFGGLYQKIVLTKHTS